MSERRLVIGIYYHPEAYPPTLNAVAELSRCFGKISMVHRPNLKGGWKYPPNVNVIASGSFITSSDQEKASTLKKIFFFLRFMADLLKESIRNRPQVILLYDYHALFAYSLIRPFLFFRHKLWYHNHDIAEISRQRKFSIGWFACKAEKRIFKRLDIFTIPSTERLRFFPMEAFKGVYFIVPNYPSLEFYQSFYRPGKKLDEIRLIFQGRIGEGHGLEEIIPLLAGPVNGKRLFLVLKGYCEQEYKERLIQIAIQHNVVDKIEFIGFTPYEEVPKIASSCHIGIGIFSKKEVMHVTLGTASNKLYEYAALGLPVIYLKEEHFSKYLQQYKWAFGVDLSESSIKTKLTEIADNWESYSASAYQSFRDELNFESFFQPVKKLITTYDI